MWSSVFLYFLDYQPSFNLLWSIVCPCPSSNIVELPWCLPWVIQSTTKWRTASLFGQRMSYCFQMFYDEILFEALFIRWRDLWCTFSLRSALFLLQPSWMRVSLFVKSTSEKGLILVDSLLYGLENHSYPFRFLYQKEIRTECNYWPPLSCQNDISFAGGKNTSL